MQAVILAAGKNRTSQGFPPDYKPKCLLHLKGETILEHNVKLLRKHGVKDISIVVGYKASTIKKFSKKKKLRLKFIVNEKPSKWRIGKRTFTSLLLGIRAVSRRSFLLIFGDVFFSEELLINLLRCKSKFCINKGGHIMAIKLNRRALGDLEKMKKEIFSYEPKNQRRHPAVIGFNFYLRKRGAKIVDGKFQELDYFWISDEGIVAREAIKRFD